MTNLHSSKKVGSIYLEGKWMRNSVSIMRNDLDVGAATNFPAR